MKLLFTIAALAGGLAGNPGYAVQNISDQTEESLRNLDIISYVAYLEQVYAADKAAMQPPAQGRKRPGATAEEAPAKRHRIAVPQTDGDVTSPFSLLPPELIITIYGYLTASGDPVTVSEVLRNAPDRRTYHLILQSVEALDFTATARKSKKLRIAMRRHIWPAYNRLKKLTVDPTDDIDVGEFNRLMRDNRETLRHLDLIDYRHLGKRLHLPPSACTPSGIDFGFMAQMPALRHLQIHGFNIEKEALSRFFEACASPMESLELCCIGIADTPTLRMILTAPRCGKLTRLVFGGTEHTVRPIDDLMPELFPQSLRNFGITHTCTTPGALRRFTQSPEASRLNRFDCTGLRFEDPLGNSPDGMIPIGDQGAAAFVAWESGSALTALNVSACAISDAGSLYIRDLMRRSPLRVIDIGKNRLSDTGFANLISGEGASKLTELYVENSHFCLHTLRRFVKAAALPSLCRLSLAHNLLRAPSIELLAGAPWLAQVRVLDLSRNEIGDDGVRALSASPFTLNIDDLNLRHCAIEREGLFTLGLWPRFEALQCLYIGRNRFGHDDALAFAAAFAVPEDNDLDTYRQ